MRPVTVVLVALLVLVQYPLWWGHGGWLQVQSLREALNAQQLKNDDEKLRNQQIEGEVQDLQNGTAAVEERARYEMGMVKDDEVFVQFVSTDLPASSVAETSTNVSTRGEVSAVPLGIVPNPAPRKSKKSQSSSRSGKNNEKKANVTPPVQHKKRSGV